MNFVQQYINYFAKRPLLNAILVLIYYLLVVLPHENIGAWIAKTLDQPLGRDTYNLIIMGMGVTGFIVYLYLIWRGTKSKAHSTSTWLYLALTLGLIIYCINVLMVVNVEMIHFVQYAIFAFLIFPLTQNYQLTLFYATIFGAIDEAYQYLVLAPETSNYYDFNDVFIDMTGATLGLILIRAYGIRDGETTQPFYKRPVFIGLVSLIMLTVLSFLLGWTSLYAHPTTDVFFPLLKYKMKPDFWSTSLRTDKFNVVHSFKFHVIRPWEWILLTIGLWTAYRNIGK